MAKLYYKYGSMGSSKTANALMTKFNYEEKGKRVLLLKPSIDNRDGEDVIKSRIGLEAKAECIDVKTDIKKYIVTDAGNSNIILGGNEKYEAMCYKCYFNAVHGVK